MKQAGLTGSEPDDGTQDGDSGAGAQAGRGAARAGRGAGRAAKPLENRALGDLALAYVARFATSAAKLESYLARKLATRGWAREGEPAEAVAAIVRKCVEAGYVDDAGYARAKAGGLLRRGYGARRISQALDQAGIDREVAGAVLPDELAAWAAALALARRRGLGPFARERAERDGEGPAEARARREKAVAAMLRAGHRLDIVRQLFDCPDAVSAEQWAEDPDA